MNQPKSPRRIIGWREVVELPELCSTPIKVKIDTGARTSALHAFDLKVEERDGKFWADFEIHPVQRSGRDTTRVSYPVTMFRNVRSSTGHTQRRPVIKTPIRIGNLKFTIEVTLTSRDEMGFRMLLGRSAVSRRYLVDSSRSYLQSDKPRRKDTP